MTQLKSIAIYDWLRAAILNGEYKPGDRLVLRAIAEHHNTSEIPAREAIQMLVRDGLVETKPYVGASVVRPSLEGVRESMVVRANLESLATKLAASNVTEEDLAALQEIIANMEESSAEGNMASYAKLNRDFHHVIYRMSSNKVLQQVLSNLEAAQVNVQLVFTLQADRVERSIEEHKEIVECLRTGDSERAATVALKHKLGVVSSLESGLSQFASLSA